MDLKEKIIEIRNKNPKSWNKLAKEIGISLPCFFNWKSGKQVQEITELKIKNYVERNK